MAKTTKTTAPAAPNAGAQKPEPRRSPHGRATPQSAGRREPAEPRPRRNAGPKPAAEPAGRTTNFTFYVNPTLALACRPVEAPVHFSLGLSADLTGVHPEMLRYYCRLGLLGADRGEGGREPTFDEEALHEVRRIEHYRRHLAIGRQALPLICELRRRAEREHIEIHFLRSP